MSQKQNVYLSDLHFEHELWLKELVFWEEEIGIYNKRLEEVVKRWSDIDVRASLEHFQNQFIRHNEVIDILKHDVRKHESQISKYAIDNPVAIDHVHFDDHTELRDRMDTQRKIYNDLKAEYYQFLVKVM